MSPTAAIAQDAKELKRGVVISYLGNAVKLGMPVLLALATNAYGAERWGVFTVYQAVVLLCVRVAAFGLDKTLLWAVPQRPEGEEGAVTAPALAAVALGSCAIAAALCVGAQVWPFEVESHRAILRLCALSLPPFALSDLLLHATMGRRRLEYQVLVRDTLSPGLQVALALLLFRLGVAESGLAWAFFVSQLCGLVVAAFGFRRVFPAARFWPASGTRLPRPLLRYAMPLWMAEMSNSLLLRVDTFVLASLTDPATLGVWAIVAQFANALRQIRRAYDPLVTAITARIAVEHDGKRLAEAFSRAGQMVSLTQLPVFVFLLCFSDVILPLYGAGFERGSDALMLLSALFLVSGGMGLAGLVINGYGRSGLTLLNTLLAVGAQLALLALLVPRFGLLGAAASVGGALCFTNLLQMLQMRSITGSFNLTRRTRLSALAVGICLAAAGAGYLAADAAALGAWPRRLLPFGAFAAAYASVALYAWRRGLLS